MSSLHTRRRLLERQADQDYARAQFVVQLVCMATGACAHDVAGGGRSALTAKARQSAMYLTHVACGLPLQRVGQAFARDRATVAYACNRVEEMRDDPAFDALLRALEACIRAAPSASFP